MQIALRMFGRQLELQTKALQLAPISASGSGWWPTIRESVTGAWQKNIEVSASTALAYSAVYACVTLIAADIAKLCLRLVERDDNGIWSEIESPAFSPVLRKPNRYQTIDKFVEQWIVSKLTSGKTFVLKQRDNRRIVNGMYVLDPSKVTPLVAADGSVYYEIKRHDLEGQPRDTPIVVPASEVMHDIMCPLYHPLIGVTPIYACGMAALQGLSIQGNSQKFFANGSNPSGMLTAPGAIGNETAARLKAKFDEGGFSGDNVGKVVVAGDGLKYEQFTMTAVDAQLIEQLKWTAETVCSCFHVPPYLVGVGPAPPYANFEPLVQAYYSQCLQNLMTSFERCLDGGLGLIEKIDGRQFGTEFDIDDLIWMDTVARGKAAGDSVGTLSPNESRRRYYNAKPVPGGDSPMVQQQYYSLAALAQRDAGDPFAKPTPQVTAPPSTQNQASTAKLAASAGDLLMKELGMVEQAA